PSAADLNGQWRLVSPAAFSSISATRNATGAPVVFGILSAGGSLWENDRSFNPSAADLNGQWREVSPAAFASISATRNATGAPVVYGMVLSDASLWENDRDFNPTATDLNTQWMILPNFGNGTSARPSLATSRRPRRNGSSI